MFARHSTAVFRPFHSREICEQQERKEVGGERGGGGGGRGRKELVSVFVLISTRGNTVPRFANTGLFIYYLYKYIHVVWRIARAHACTVVYKFSLYINMYPVARAISIPALPLLPLRRYSHV